MTEGPSYQGGRPVQALWGELGLVAGAISCLLATTYCPYRALPPTTGQNLLASQVTSRAVCVGGGLPSMLRTCAGWYFQVHALVFVSQAEIVHIACPQTRKEHFWWMRVGRSPLYSQVLLLPLGVCPTPACLSRVTGELLHKGGGWRSRWGMEGPPLPACRP